MSEIDSQKYLSPSFLHLLQKEGKLEIDEIVYLFQKTVEIIQKDSRLHEIEIVESEDENAPVAQVGFSFDYDTNTLSHLITVNYRAMIDYPIPRILLVAAHECGHLYYQDSKATDVEKGIISPDEYYEFIRRKSGDWYEQEAELQADEFGYHRSKNIYQRAIHDSDDITLKRFFMDCMEQLELNEMLEMEKHRRAIEESSQKK